MELPGHPLPDGQITYGWRRRREEVSEEPVPAVPMSEPDPEEEE